MAERVTLKKIAELANVSIGTVDRAMNGRGRINEETRVRIMEIAKMLDYKPNNAAKAMSKQNRFRIGIVMSDSPEELNTHMKNGVKDALNEFYDYGVTGDFFISRTLAPKLQLEAISKIRADDYDAFLVNAGSTELIPWINDMVKAGKYVATFNSDAVNSSRGFHVGEDPFRAGQLIGGFMSFCLHAEAPRIAILTGFAGNSSHSNRCAGVMEAIMEVNHNSRMIHDAYEDEPVLVRQIMEKLLNDSKPIDAVFFASGIGADIGCEVIQTMPADKRPMVFGYDVVKSIIPYMNNGICRGCICQDTYWQGYYGARILAQYGVFGETPTREIYRIRSKLITRHNATDYLFDKHQSDAFLL